MTTSFRRGGESIMKIKLVFLLVMFVYRENGGRPKNAVKRTRVLLQRQPCCSCRSNYINPNIIFASRNDDKVLVAVFILFNRS